jgi:zinc protease
MGVLVATTTLFALIFAAATTVRGDTRTGLFDPQQFTLENGMQVVVISDHRAPVVTHMVWYKVGAADDPPGKSGLAHYFEHMMFKGTKNVPAGQFSQTVASLGGRENAFTSYDYTGYFQTIASAHLETMMRLEADRMANLVVREEDIAAEREVVQEERRSRLENNPSGLLGEQMNSAQFLSHPYGRPVIGWEHEVAELSRQDLLNFYATHYAPNNAILVVAGDVTLDEARPLSERYYGRIPAGEVVARKRLREPPQRAARRVTMRDPRVRVPSWSRTYLAPSRTAGETQHALPLQVLSEILGGGTTARLYKRLVIEEKVASGAGASYRGSSMDLSRFYVYASPQPGGDLESIEAMIEEEIVKLLETGVTEEELRRAKSGMVAGAVFSRDSLAAGARFFGAALAVGRTAEDVESWPERIDAVTADEILAAARHVFNERLSVTGFLLPKQDG